MPAICDISLLLSLATNRHIHHVSASRWLDRAGHAEAVICRVAQMGLLRLLNNPAVLKEEAFDTSDCWKLWHKMIQDERFRYMSTEPAELDVHFVSYTKGRSFTPKLWTDAYIAAFAQAARMEVATFDHGFRNFAGLRCQVLESV